MTEAHRSADQRTFWVAEVFHPSGNSAHCYWSGGDRTHDKIYCAAQFQDGALCSLVCELLNLKWPFPFTQGGKFVRAVEHAWIEKDVPR